MEFHIKITDRLRNFSEHVEVKQTQDGMVIGEYKMALNDIIRALSNSSTEGIGHQTPFLPRNCIKLLTNTYGYDVFIELEKRQWQIEHTEEGKLMLGFPKLVLKYSVVKDTIQNLKMFAVKDKGLITGDTEMYFFPYSNVHHDSGNVCMGMNVFPEIKHLNQLEKMHLLFFSAPFGNDYGSMAIGHNLNSLLKTFRDKSFDDEVLMPMNQTFNEVFLLQNNG